MAPNWMSCRILFMLFGVRTDIYFFKEINLYIFLGWYFRICFPCTCPCVCPSGTVMCMPCCWEMDEIFHKCRKCHHKMNGLDLLEIENNRRRVRVSIIEKNVFWYDFLILQNKRKIFTKIFLSYFLYVLWSIGNTDLCVL